MKTKQQKLKQLGKIAVLALTAVSALTAFGQDDDIAKDFNALGGNKEIVRRARMLDPENRVRIVQNRMVDRRWRLEIGGLAGAVTGGDTFMDSHNLGAQIDLHITPSFSVGGRVYQTMNQLSAQGKRSFETARAQQNQSSTFDRIPEVNWVERTSLVTAAWYPIYGKLNLFDLSVAQFDVYTLIGAGSVLVNRKSITDIAIDKKEYPTFTVGGGVGVWLSKHFSTRFEARYQTYADEIGANNDKRDLDLFVFGMSIGLIL